MIPVGERPAWHARAACRGIGPEVMFPVDGVGVAEAKSYCAGCPVRDACAADGFFEPFGVWGGDSERARRRLRSLAGVTVAARYRDPADSENDNEDDGPEEGSAA